MCTCIEEIIQRMKLQEGYERIQSPIELFSGRVYLSFTVRKAGKQKLEYEHLLLTKCPICGKAYEEENKSFLDEDNRGKDGK